MQPLTSILVILLGSNLFLVGHANPLFGHYSSQAASVSAASISGSPVNSTARNGTFTFLRSSGSSRSSRSLQTYEPHGLVSSTTLSASQTQELPITANNPSSTERASPELHSRPSGLNGSNGTDAYLVKATTSSNLEPQVSGMPSNFTRANTTYVYAAKTASLSRFPAQVSGAFFNSSITNGTFGHASQNFSLIYPAPPRVFGDRFVPAVSNEDSSYSLQNLSTPHPSAIANGSWAGPTQQSSSSSAAAEVEKPKMVFAHFMVGNVHSWSIDDWKSDMRKAQAAHIDAFALNMAADDKKNLESVSLAFSAATDLGFKLVFSFDYAGGGPWNINIVIVFLLEFSSRPAYYHYNGKPFVSTFEGPDNAADWVTIKDLVPCFFIPDWSSKGAKDAMQLGGGVADGLFSWAAWPWGNTDMNTYVDASYDEYLKGKPYMMPVSPWFFTNLPGYDGKNWVWRGDDLWHDRWAETLVVQPHFVQIISWNDYGESHYIGPLGDRAYGAFSTGLAPYNYVLDMPHDGWRDILPFAIDLYKHNTASFTNEVLVTWYRKHPGAACSTGGTSGSTASQLLIEFQPSAVSQDMIFYSALLGSEAAVSVSIGGVNLGGSFQDKPSGGVGLYHGSVATGGRTGAVVVSVKSMKVNGKSITTTCEQGIQNWNAWVGSASSGAMAAKTPALAVDKQECILGTAPGIFAEICTFTCAYGYCPLGACQCLALGAPVTKPPSTGIKGYPAVGMSASFEGLCNFACNLGKCPTDVCGTVLVLPFTIFPSSPFLPPACRSGTAVGRWEGLCSFACNFGYCPINTCTCTSTGVLILPPDSDAEKKGYPLNGLPDSGLCNFACSRGWCPSDVCTLDEASSGDDEDLEDIDPSLYLESCDDAYDSLDAIEAAGTEIPSHCLDKYIVVLQAKELATAISDYQALMAANYDEKFETYSSYTADLVWPSIVAFMEANGRNYFSCFYTQKKICCTDCTNAGCRDPDNCEAAPCVGIGERKAVECPKQVISIGDLAPQPYDYIFIMNDQDGFEKELEEKYGVSTSWLVYTRYKAWAAQGCWQQPDPTDDCYVWWSNFPMAAASITVPDPKDVFQRSLSDLAALQESLLDAALPEGLQWYAESTSDVADAATMPVAMASNAVALMKAVAKKADEIKEAEKKEMIILFATSFLMFIPIVGSGAQGVGFATLGNIIRMAGAAADTALGIWGIVQDPTSAVFVIFAALFGLRDYSKASAKRRSMSDLELNALGKDIAGPMRRVNDMKNNYYCKM